MKVAENLFSEKFIENSYVELPHRGNSNVYLQHMYRQFLCVATTYVTENKEENYLEIFTFSKYHVHCLYLF